MRKRCTIVGSNGILSEMEDTNSFELDWYALKKRYPNANGIVFDVEIDGNYIEVATVYLAQDVRSSSIEV